jgi:uncharacterized protein
MSNKYLVNLQHGTDDLEKATIAMMVAGAAAAMDSETVIFLTCESVRLATTGAMDGVQKDGYPALAELQEAFLENKGQLWVCPVCAASRGITAEDLAPGAEIAGAGRTIGYVNDGAQVLM